uniref:hypothetical protein n=1 Tax=Shewanella sp. TaxID=50422 RepID=UPI0040481965
MNALDQLFAPATPTSSEDLIAQYQAMKAKQKPLNPLAYTKNTESTVINLYLDDLFNCSRNDNKAKFNVFLQHETRLKNESNEVAAIELIELYRSMFDCGAELIETFRLKFAEYKNSMPTTKETLTVYRGVFHTEAQDGISWSTNIDVARKFGNQVIEREVQPHQVLAVIGGEEFEIICNFKA